MVQEALLADIRGFMKSRVILTACELDFFTVIDEKISSADEISKTLKIDPRATTRILDCLVTFGLLNKKKAKYSITEKSRFLSSHHPESILPMVLHMSHLWMNWSELTEIVKKGSEREVKSGLRFTEQDWNAFIGAMHVAAKELSKEIAEAYDASRFKKLLDVGGASGTYAIAFLKKNPNLKAVIFDLEDVIPMATRRVHSEGLSERVECIAGDFYKDELPSGCDLALLSAIIHQNGPQENIELFKKIYKALVPGGTLLIRDHIMDESRTQPSAGVLFAINMLVNTRGGDTYTFVEAKNALESAAFSDVRLLRTGEKMDCLVEACKHA